MLEIKKSKIKRCTASQGVPIAKGHGQSARPQGPGIRPQKLIVVLGMHRSGTSAVTRGLQVMGVGLGDRLMPGLEGNNAKGFWEDIDLNALNIEMMSSID